MAAASSAIGRALFISQWLGDPNWAANVREMLAPFALWAAPTAYALHRGELLNQEPFRGFSGGRSRDEGGGASRIRSSRRLGFEELHNES